MKIAVYSGTIPSSTFIENLILGLAERGHTIYLFGKKTSAVRYPPNVKLYVTPSSPTGLVAAVTRDALLLLITKRKRFFKALKMVRKKGSLSSMLQKAGTIFPVLLHEPDIFHIQWGKSISHHSELLELTNAKLVLSLRGTHINYSPLFDSKLAKAYHKYFPRLHGFHAVSKTISLVAQQYDADPAKIKVIYSAVADDILMQSNAGKKTAGSRTRIVSIGRTHWIKGYSYALDAMEMLKNEGMDFEYTIVAPGNISEEALYHIEDAGIGGHMRIINGLGHAEVIALVKEQDILLLSSLEEGIANVVLEAMAAGTIVISTDCGGMHEVITHGENGFLVPVRDAGAIAAAVKEIRSLPGDKLKAITIAARDKIAGMHRPDKQMQEFEQLYGDILRD